MITTYRQILNQQHAWAEKHNIKFDEKGYILRLNDNLFCPSVDGSGNHLGSPCDTEEWATTSEFNPLTSCTPKYKLVCFGQLATADSLLFHKETDERVASI